MKRLETDMPASVLPRNLDDARAEFNETIVGRVIIIYGLFLLVSGILMSSPADWLPGLRNIVLSSFYRCFPLLQIQQNQISRLCAAGTVRHLSRASGLECRFSLWSAYPAGGFICLAAGYIVRFFAAAGL